MYTKNKNNPGERIRITASLRFFLFIFLLLLTYPGYTQLGLPVIKSGSGSVKIYDGAYTITNDLDPKLKPDIYNAKRSKSEKLITYRTDEDSISFKIHPGKIYDFIILVNNKDTCRQRISAENQTYHKENRREIITRDTIPFTLGADNKIHIKGRINQSDLLDLLFDTGAGTIVLYPSGQRKKVHLKYDGTADNIGVGGKEALQTSSSNRLSICKLRWDAESVMSEENQVDQADGVIGFNVFSDKIVEIDYDKNLMIIHDSLFPIDKSYRRLPIRYSDELLTFQATIVNGKTRNTDWFIFDSGAPVFVYLNPGFAAKHQLPGKMKILGSSTSGGTGPGTFKNISVLLPELQIAGFSLPEVRMDIPAQGGFSFGSILGMGVMKRLNTIIDYQHNFIYLKPNRSGG